MTYFNGFLTYSIFYAFLSVCSTIPLYAQQMYPQRPIERPDLSYVCSNPAMTCDYCRTQALNVCIRMYPEDFVVTGEQTVMIPNEQNGMDEFKTPTGTSRGTLCNDVAQRAMEAAMSQNKCIMILEEEGDVTRTGDVDIDVPGNGGGDQKAGGGGSGGSPETVKADPGTSSSDLQQDLETCNSNRQRAQKCCNNPAQCGAQINSASGAILNSTDPESIKRYCEQLRYEGLNNSSSNSSAAGVCSSAYTFCSQKCSNIVRKWQQKLPSCRLPSCDPSAVSQAISLMNTRVRECDQFEPVARALSQQSGESYSAAQQSQLCANQATQENPNLASTPSQGQPGGQDPNSGVDCTQYPNSPTCMGGYQDPGGLNPSDPSSTLKPTDGSGSLSMTDFNTGAGIDGLPQFPQYGDYEPQSAQGTPVPNGGGGVPGGSAAAGSGFEGTTASASNMGEKSNTDILHGEGGSGGYSSGAGGSDGSGEPGGGGGFSGYGSKGNDSFKSKFGGLDLKAYLPGGAKDPKRKLASANESSTGHPDIAPRGVSMFKRISDHYSLMCKLKQFMGCE